jgi:hypothetical protein
MPQKRPFDGKNTVFTGKRCPSSGKKTVYSLVKMKRQWYKRKARCTSPLAILRGWSVNPLINPKYPVSGQIKEVKGK